MTSNIRIFLSSLTLMSLMAGSASANVTIDGVDLEDLTADDYLQFFEDEVGGDQVFSDVSADHWAFPYLGGNAPLISSGAIDTSEDLYRCNEPATRAEAVKIISEVFEIPGMESDTSFEDVNSEAWYSPYIENLTRLGVVNGYSDGTFKPNNEISRAEIVKILATLMYESTGWMGEDPFDIENYLEMEQVGFESVNFTDVSESDWFFPYVDLFSRASLVDGYEDQTFRPDQNVTRCELAKLTGQSYFVFATTVTIVQGFVEAFTGEISEDRADLLENFWEQL